MANEKQAFDGVYNGTVSERPVKDNKQHAQHDEGLSKKQFSPSLSGTYVGGSLQVIYTPMVPPLIHSKIPSPAFCICASYTKPQPDSFARCRKWAESVDKTEELEYKEITTKTFLEHNSIHGTENVFG